MGISLFLGGSKRLPRWFGARTVFGSMQPCRMVTMARKKCPRVPGWVRGGGGQIAIWAMPKCRGRQTKWVFLYHLTYWTSGLGEYSDMLSFVLNHFLIVKFWPTQKYSDLYQFVHFEGSRNQYKPKLYFFKMWKLFKEGILTFDPYN